MGEYACVSLGGEQTLVQRGACIGSHACGTTSHYDGSGAFATEGMRMGPRLLSRRLCLYRYWYISIDNSNRKRIHAWQPTPVKSLPMPLRPRRLPLLWMLVIVLARATICLSKQALLMRQRSPVFSWWRINLTKETTFVMK